jgi:hypothetical protein
MHIGLQQKSNRYKPTKKELLVVIVEVGLDEGLDVLASFNSGIEKADLKT